MANFLTWLSRLRFPYDPLITVEISEKRLIHNLTEFQKIAPRGQVALVLKSNAYGHGLFEVASILERYRNGRFGSGNAEGARGISFFVVDSYFEAIALRGRGVKTPILVIGYTRPETIIGSRLHRVVFTVTSLETLRELESADHTVPIHLKIDTGMHRQGIFPDEIDEALSILGNNQHIELRGVCSHLCDSDDNDPSFTEQQIAVWNKAVKKVRSAVPTLKYAHLSASDGHRFTGDIDANVSRVGIGLYGLIDGSAFSPKLDLQPVLSMKTVLSGIKKLKRDLTVGYGNTFRADRDMTIATIPVGYYEGVDRRLSNQGTVQVGHKNIPCPIIGRVSMNITTIDVSEAIEMKEDVKIGMPVTVFSDNPNDSNSIQSVAKACGTIPYEIAVHIPAHLKRVVVGS